VTFPALYERTLELVWKRKSRFKLGRSIRCKIFGDDHQKNNLQLQIIVKRPPAGRRKLMGEKGHDEKECS